MDGLFVFSDAHRQDRAVDEWLATCDDDRGEIARHWFGVMRRCGADVQELLHDGHPVACVGNTAFAYVAVFTRHVNVGFFRGAELDDPTGLLQGSGKYMRHVKLRPGETIDTDALDQLVITAYEDMQLRLSLRRDPPLAG